MLRRCVLMFLMLGGESACAYRTPSVHVPSATPPLAPDSLRCAEIVVVDGAGGISAASRIVHVQRSARAILTDTKWPASSIAEPTRVILRVRVDQARDVFDERRLAAAADAEVTDADDGPREPAPTTGMTRVPAAPPRGRRAVETAERADQLERAR